MPAFAMVGRPEGGRVAELGNRGLAGFGVDVADHDPGALGDQLARGDPPETAGPTRDDRNLAGKLLSMHVPNTTTP